MSQRRFKHWAYLNSEGRLEYCEIFPNGQVPIVSMIVSEVDLDGLKFSQASYLIYHEEMTPQQVDQLLTKIADKFQAPKEDVRAQMLKDRIPLRVALTEGSGTDGLALFM